MQELQQKLQADYKRVQGAWGNQDYVDFLRQLRPTIENFCRIVIMDIKGPTLYEEIMDGEYHIESMKNLPKGQPIQNSLLAKVIPALVKEEMTLDKRKYNRIQNTCNRLIEAFNVTSELASHTGKTGLNPELRAYDNLQLLPTCIEGFESCNILSKEVISFLYETITPLGISTATTSNSDNLIQESYNEKMQELQQELIQKEKVINSQQAMINDAQQQTLSAQRAAFEAEKAKTVADARIEELTRQLETINDKLDENKVLHDESVNDIPQYESEKTVKELSIGTESMDDDQLDLIESNMESSMLVAGCAGSGKSIIALHKAQQIIKSGASVILIAYTKSLRSFMDVGWKDKQLKSYCMYHNQWKDCDMPTADYIIVDEIQDFTEIEIREFMNAAKKCFFFFGDTAQSIYNFTNRPTLTIEQISEMTGIEIMMLYNNYRLPRPVAKITQDYVGVNVQPYRDKVYMSREQDLPSIVSFKSDEEQLQTLIDMLKNTDMSDTGILFPENTMVKDVFHRLLDEKLYVECKYSLDYNEQINTLNFATHKPKLMTYHSSKGLQFKKVIIPFCQSITDEEEQKSLYVAMTRTYKNLIIFYTGNTRPIPLDRIPDYLFLKSYN